MISRKVNSQGFELNYSVPSSTDEYNSLAPKRNNPVLEDAIQNVLYRNVFNKFRDRLCEALEKSTRIARINNGTAEDPNWESEGKYIRRVMVAVAQQRGLDPAAKSTRDTLLNEWTPLAQTVLTGGSLSFTKEDGTPETVTYQPVAFDPSEREPSSGPAIAKTYITWAEQAIAADGGQKVAGLLSKFLNREVTLTGDKEADTKTLAQAIADREKIKRDELARASKLELGLAE